MASRSEIAQLLASLELKDKFSPAIRNADKALGKFDANLDRTSSRAHLAGQQIGTGIKNAGKIAAVGIGIVAANVALGLDSLIKLEKQTAQTEAVIASTGGAAGLTAKDIRALAEEYEALNATIGDETIQEAENLLLGFTNVRKDAFEPALAAALDMNTRLGKGPDGLTTTIRTLGKALNDPTKGLGALSKAGVTFSAEQTKRIKQLQEEGRLYEAQTLILDELNKRFGGAFAAEGGTTAGTVAKFTDAIEDTQRVLATALLPTVRNVADALTDLLQDPEIQRGVEQLGEAIGGMLSKENIKEGARIIGDVVKSVAAAAPTIAAGLTTAANVIGAVISAFQKLPPEVQQLAVGAFAVNKLTGGLLTNVAGGIFGALKSMTVTAGVVNVLSKGPPLPPGVPTPGSQPGSKPSLNLPLPGATVPLNEIFGKLENADRIDRERFLELKRQGKSDAEAMQGAMTDLRISIFDTKEGVESKVAEATAKAIAAAAQAKSKADAAIQATKQTASAVDQTKQHVGTKVQETTRETTRGSQQVQASQRSAATTVAISQAIAASRIVAAIYAARPVISVTNVTHTYNNLTNSGPPGADRAQGTGYGIYPK